MSSSNYPLHCSMNLCKCIYFFPLHIRDVVQLNKLLAYFQCNGPLQTKTHSFDSTAILICLKKREKYLSQVYFKIDFFYYTWISILNWIEIGIDVGIQTWINTVVEIWHGTSLCCLIRNKAWDKIQIKINWVLYISFDRFLLAVDSRDLSQPDKSIIIKSVFFFNLQNFNFWTIKFTVIQKNYLALGNLILSFQNL